MIPVVAIALLVVGTILMFVSNERGRNKKAQSERDAEAAADQTFSINQQALTAQLFDGWPIHHPVKIAGEDGHIGMRGDGSEIRLVTYRRDDVRCEVQKDETLPITFVSGVSINQPQRAKTIVHKETTPVAVGSGRSPGGRALAGALLAGPTGAMVGAASGLGGKSRLKHVDTKRNQTVYVKGHPRLILDVDDLMTPRRVLEFDTVTLTNEWSSRIWNARNRQNQKL